MSRAGTRLGGQKRSLTNRLNEPAVSKIAPRTPLSSFAASCLQGVAWVRGQEEFNRWAVASSTMLGAAAAAAASRLKPESAGLTSAGLKRIDEMVMNRVNEGEVVVDAVEARLRKPNGTYGWDGAFATYWTVNRKEQLVTILFIQTPGRAIHHDFDNAVSQAVIE